jgi:hypothetical protein
VDPVDYKGPTGIVGVLQHACIAANVPSVSLWAAVPHYVAATPSPKAALALVRQASTLLATPLTTTDLEIMAASYERQVTEVVASDDDVAAYVQQLEIEHDDEPLDADGEHEPRRGLPAFRQQPDEEDGGTACQEGDEDERHEPFVDERRQDHRHTDCDGCPEREASAGKERRDDRHDRDDVEPKRARRALCFALTERCPRERHAEPRQDQRIEPVAAREPQDSLHTSKVLQNRPRRVVPESDRRSSPRTTPKPSRRTTRNRPRARWQARPPAVRSIGG